MSKRWMSSGYMQSAPTGGINSEKGIIEGVSVCTVGEAKGHGVNLDLGFIQEIERQGNAKSSGLKARFGHPNMCSTALGTFIGRFKNFRTVGEQVKADLFLSNEAKNTPHGDLYSYVLGMATNEPDMFGTSIVFTPGRTYQRDANGEKVIVDEFSANPDMPLFIECETLHACDAVDDPAANDGMFSRFSQETVAGQITEFLDLNPQVFDALSSNPQVVEALARYGDKVKQFMARYAEYTTKTEEQKMADEKIDEKLIEAETPESVEVVEDVEAVEPVEVSAEPETEAVEAEAEEIATPESEAVAEPEAEVMNRCELSEIVTRFGAEIAAEVILNGGNPAEIAYARAQEEIVQLKARIKELESMKTSTAKPAKACESTEKKPLIRIHGRG